MPLQDQGHSASFPRVPNLLILQCYQNPTTLPGRQDPSPFGGSRFCYPKLSELHIHLSCPVQKGVEDLLCGLGWNCRWQVGGGRRERLDVCVVTRAVDRVRQHVRKPFNNWEWSKVSVIQLLRGSLGFDVSAVEPYHVACLETWNGEVSVRRILLILFDCLLELFL